MNTPLRELEQPLVTIVTVAYNSARYIREAIDSVLAQSYTNFEFIIGDDCSTDETWSIIQSYQDPRIRAYRNETNLREYPNRNKAIQLARGKYLVFLDADDILLHRGIACAVEEMEEAEDCGVAVVRPENPKFIGPLRIARADALMLDFFGGGVLDSSLANNFFRVDFLKQHPFLEHYRSADTFSRVLFMLHTNLMVLINPIAIWRQSDDQASRGLSYAVRLRETIQFYHDHLLPNAELLRILPEGALRKRYYRMIARLAMLELQSFRSPLYLKKYLIDSWSVIMKSWRQPEPPEFWKEYNYTNLHARFRERSK